MHWKKRQKQIQYLRLKHGSDRSLAREFQDLKVGQRTAPCSNGIRRRTARRVLPPGMKQFPVFHCHKQGYELIVPGTDLRWMGGKKPCELISLVTPDSNSATRPQRAGVKRSAGNRHRFGSAMNSYSIRFASGHISPNLDPQVCDCWLDTTGELHRAQRPDRCKVRNALSMPRGQRAWRNGRPPPPRQTVHTAPLRLPGECCRPNRWRRGDRLALAAHALHSRPAHSTAARRAKARTRCRRRMTARGTLSSWSN